MSPQGSDLTGDAYRAAGGDPGHQCSGVTGLGVKTGSREEPHPFPSME